MALIDPIEASLLEVDRQINKAERLNRTRIAASVADLSKVVNFAWNAFQQCSTTHEVLSNSLLAEHVKAYPATHIDDELLTEKEAARLLKTHPGTLANWRCNGAVAIPFIKLGRIVRYRRSVLERLLINGFDS